MALFQIRYKCKHNGSLELVGTRTEQEDEYYRLRTQLCPLCLAADQQSQYSKGGPRFCIRAWTPRKELGPGWLVSCYAGSYEIRRELHKRGYAFVVVYGPDEEIRVSRFVRPRVGWALHLMGQPDGVRIRVGREFEWIAERGYRLDLRDGAEEFLDVDLGEAEIEVIDNDERSISGGTGKAGGIEKGENQGLWLRGESGRDQKAGSGSSAQKLD